jgi:hypothetical protein
LKNHKDKSWENVRKYREGKEQLKNAILQHPDEDPKTSIYDFVKRNTIRKLWVIPFNQFKRKGGQ